MAFVDIAVSIYKFVHFKIWFSIADSPNCQWFWCIDSYNINGVSRCMVCSANTEIISAVGI